MHVTKIICRVFTTKGHGVKGGNPLTIFLFDNAGTTTEISATTNAESGKDKSSAILSNYEHRLSKIQRSLAQGCDWESVMVHYNNCPSDQADEIYHNVNKHKPNLKFYMPSGEEVEFCAHAAMGACVGLNMKLNRASSDAFSNKERNDHLDHYRKDMEFTSQDGEIHHSSILKNNSMVELKMEAPLLERDLLSYNDENNRDIFYDILKQLGLSTNDVLGYSDSATSKMPYTHEMELPSFLNASISRTKTLIPIRNIERLHAATNPTDPQKFRDFCDAIESTGIYLYSPITAKPQNSNHFPIGQREFECRQFPRASGYPEDPATGIAAGALAASLHNRYNENIILDQSSRDTKYHISDEKDENKRDTSFIIHQGTAMKRPSQIMIRFENDLNVGNCLDTTLFCSGMVDIDSKTILNLHELEKE